MFGEGQGNEGSDKCSERVEDSWMQRAEKTWDGRGNAEGDGCTCASRVARALSRRIPFSGSFPTARARRGGPFSVPRIRGIPNPRRLRSVKPGIRDSIGGPGV